MWSTEPSAHLQWDVQCHTWGVGRDPLLVLGGSERMDVRVSQSLALAVEAAAATPPLLPLPCCPAPALTGSNSCGA